MTTPMISFVIPVRNDARRLRTCLEAIAANTRSGLILEVIVADNGSVDDSAAVASAAGASVLSLPGLRVSELRNRAASVARGALLGFVDADNEIAPTWAAAAIDALGPVDIGAAGALSSAPPDGSWVQTQFGYLRGKTVGKTEVSWLGAGNMAVRRTAFESVGGFDSSLESCEDVDLCQRLSERRWRVVGDERLENIHWGDPATLGKLFRAERWRGRDNIRVTLRGPLTARELPSLLIPIADLCALTAVIAGLLTAPWSSAGLGWAMSGLLLFAGLSAARAARSASRLPRLGFQNLGRAFVVAATYDLARAVGLLGRARHHGETPINKGPASPSLS